ncbi:MAG: aminotransferase class V-fold PLP-dependent enzyme [Limisphaerales bacterium]
MTIAELHANEDLRRHEFPVVANQIFLAHAAVCPLPRRVSEAVRDYAAAASAQDQEQPVLKDLFPRCRELAAQLIGATADEIALVGPTSLALSFIAGGLPLRKGDNVIVYQDDYPSNVYPWMALTARGVQVRFLPARGLGRIRVADVLGQVDEDTRLVALASCHFISGWRLELEAVGRVLAERRIAFSVDGIQTLGAFPTSAAAFDFTCADSHKWLLGPCGAGFLYVKRAWHDRLQPVVHGWHNVRCPEFVAQDRIEFRRGAQRYEAGSQNVLGLVGLRAAFELLLEIGVDAIAAELLRKRAWLVPALQAKGWNVMHPDAPEANRSGVVTFDRSGEDMAAVHQRLKEAGVETSLRSERSGRKWLRLSPHFYNTDAELHRVVEFL